MTSWGINVRRMAMESHDGSEGLNLGCPGLAMAFSGIDSMRNARVKIDIFEAMEICLLNISRESYSSCAVMDDGDFT